MSTEQVSTPLPFVGGKTASPQHPLGPLTASEITQSSQLIKSLWPTNTNLQFKSITLQEPIKGELIPFLEAEQTAQSTPTIGRRSFVVYYIRNTVSFLMISLLVTMHHVTHLANTETGQTTRSCGKSYLWQG
jgi:primary-amine oxidase